MNNCKHIILYAVISNLLMVSAMFLVIESKEKNMNAAASTISVLYTENGELKTELEKYKATEQELIDLGATSEQAQSIIRASEALNVSPKSSEL